MVIAREVFLLSIFVLCAMVLVKAQLKEWKIPCGAVYKPKNCENTSLEALTNVEDFERCAPAMLDPLTRDYIWSGSGEEITLQENKQAFKRIWIKKKVLRNVAKYSLQTTILGYKTVFPVGISPTTGHALVHPAEEIGTARGAASTGTIMIVSAMSTNSLEDVAASVPKETQLWMQVFIYFKRETLIDIIRRAEKSGYKAIVVTVDEMRNADIKCRARSRFVEEMEVPLGQPNIRENASETCIDETETFQDLAWIVQLTKLPIISKGILTAEDAIQCAKTGVAAIFVSNQGGRVLDGCLPTIDALPDITKAVSVLYPKVEIYVDGGIRTGSDVFKALARGAKAAFIGRPALWGLAIGGESGVKRVLTILKKEFKNVLLHAGYTKPSQIKPSSLVSNWIYNYQP